MTSTSLDLSATFVNTVKFLNTRLSITEFVQKAARGGPLAWDYLEPGKSGCHVMDNPVYTACTRTGFFWFDSPVFSETGCYMSPNFMRNFGSRIGDFDLEGFRKSDDAVCVKHTKKSYCELIDCSLSGAR